MRVPTRALGVRRPAVLGPPQPGQGPRLQETGTGLKERKVGGGHQPSQGPGLCRRPCWPPGPIRSLLPTQGPPGGCRGSRTDADLVGEGRGQRWEGLREQVLLTRWTGGRRVGGREPRTHPLNPRPRRGLDLHNRSEHLDRDRDRDRGSGCTPACPCPGVSWQLPAPPTSLTAPGLAQGAPRRADLSQVVCPEPWEDWHGEGMVNGARSRRKPFLVRHGPRSPCPRSLWGFESLWAVRAWSLTRDTGTPRGTSRGLQPQHCRAVHLCHACTLTPEVCARPPPPYAGGPGGCSAVGGVYLEEGMASAGRRWM